MLKLCENGSNIDYLYETSSVLRKAMETEISGLTFWLQFGSVRVFKNRNRTKPFPHTPSCNTTLLTCKSIHIQIMHPWLMKLNYFCQQNIKLKLQTTTTIKIKNHKLLPLLLMLSVTTSTWKFGRPLLSTTCSTTLWLELWAVKLESSLYRPRTGSGSCGFLLE